MRRKKPRPRFWGDGYYNTSIYPVKGYLNSNENTGGLQKIRAAARGIFRMEGRVEACRPH